MTATSPAPKPKYHVGSHGQRLNVWCGEPDEPGEHQVCMASTPEYAQLIANVLNAQDTLCNRGSPVDGRRCALPPHHDHVPHAYPPRIVT